MLARYHGANVALTSATCGPAAADSQAGLLLVQSAHTRCSMTTRCARTAAGCTPTTTRRRSPSGTTTACSATARTAGAASTAAVSNPKSCNNHLHMALASRRIGLRRSQQALLRRCDGGARRIRNMTYARDVTALEPALIVLSSVGHWSYWDMVLQCVRAKRCARCGRTPRLATASQQRAALGTSCFLPPSRPRTRSG